MATVWRNGLADGASTCKLLVRLHDCEPPFSDQFVREFDETAAQVMTYQAVTDQKSTSIITGRRDADSARLARESGNSFERKFMSSLIKKLQESGRVVTGVSLAALLATTALPLGAFAQNGIVARQQQPAQQQ